METIIKAIKEEVTALLSNNLSDAYMYHNLRHTQAVVSKTKVLAEGLQLPKEEAQLLELAAWLHDTGYIVDPHQHEQESCAIAKTYLGPQGLDAPAMATVCRLIKATERNHTPKDLLEEIIRDADAAHLSQKDFRAISEMLREELRRTQRGDYSLSEWRNMNISLFRNEHRYYTSYAQEHWQPGKDKNLRRLVKDRKREKRLIKKERVKAQYKNEIPDRACRPSIGPPSGITSS